MWQAFVCGFIIAREHAHDQNEKYARSLQCARCVNVRLEATAADCRRIAFDSSVFRIIIRKMKQKNETENCCWNAP